MANVIVARGGGYVDSARKYRVFIDGSERGTIRAREVQIFSVSDGRHRVRMRVDWGSSPEISVDVINRDVYVLCGPNAPALFVIVYALFLWRRWIWLKQG
jgi:hypothetical protein